MSLLNRAHAITRHIYKNQLFDWIMAITKAIAGSPALIGVGPYDTVARASALRMLDEDAGLLAGIENGSEVWVESFGGSKWVWRTDFPAATATDNETTCRPTAWIATGLDGAFVRELQGSRIAAAQAAWFVNSTALDNEGAVTVKNDFEIQRRWGPGPVPLSVPVSLTYAQAPAGVSNLQVAVQTGGSFRVFGTPVVNQTGVVITAVATQVRTAGAEVGWAVTGASFGAGDVGKLLIITQSVNAASIGAYARVRKDNGAGSVGISPFESFPEATLISVQITPVIGDVVNVVTPTVLSVGRLSFRCEFNAAIQAAPVRQCVILDGVELNGNVASTNGTIESIGCMVFYVRSIARNLSLGGTSGNSFFHTFCGGGAENVLVLRGATAQFRQTGITTQVIVLGFGRAVFQVDTYFQNATLNVSQGAAVNTQGVAFFDRTVADSCILVSAGGSVTQLTGVPDWGAANTGHGVKVQSGGLYAYATKPTINGTLGAGREALVGGTDKLYTAVPYIEGANNAALVLTA